MSIHPSQRNLTLSAMGLIGLLLCILFVVELLGGRSIVSGADPYRLYEIGLGIAVSMALLYFYWRGRDYAAKLTVLLMALTMPLIYKPLHFEYVIPQAIWIPFILALLLTGLRWALLVAGITVALLLYRFPHVYGSAPQVVASLIILLMLVAGRLTQREMLRETLLAKRRAEETSASWRENEEKYRLLSEQLPLAIQVFSPDGRTVRVNQAWEKLWGVSLAVLGDYRIFDDEQLAAAGLLDLLRGAFEGERVEMPVVKYDKARNPVLPDARGTLWIRAFAYPLYGSDGELREVVLVQEDITERIQAEEQIRNLAYFDPLTRLPNRRLLTDRLGQAMISGGRSREYGAMFILDLDYFKALNDTQGHDVGDQLLVQVAGRLSGAVRAKDTVSRFGGDEFVLILEELGADETTAIANAERVAEKVLEAIRQPFELTGRIGRYQSSTSIGITLFLGLDEPSETLLKQADVALYQAKGTGRNCISFFNPAMQAVIDERMVLDAALRNGLARGEFELFYQPQFDRQQRIVGVEALLRWCSAEHGLVSPARFVPLAEESGLILQIGKWVLETACAQLKAWSSDERTDGLQLSVNVSARQFMQPDFVRQVAQCLAESGAAPSLLKLELTESVVLDNVEGVIGKMLQLNELGVAFALDDFGTGYSSLSYLKRLPLEQLKVDQSFVRDSDSDPNAAAIVRAILAMSQSLGLQAIAEGVETEAQREFLAASGCLIYQGYLFGKPMPVAQLDAKLKAGEFSLSAAQ